MQRFCVVAHLSVIAAVENLPAYRAHHEMLDVAGRVSLVAQLCDLGMPACLHAEEPCAPAGELRHSALRWTLLFLAGTSGVTEVTAAGQTA
jgi:hypothetical protein